MIKTITLIYYALITFILVSCLNMPTRSADDLPPSFVNKIQDNLVRKTDKIIANISRDKILKSNVLSVYQGVNFRPLWINTQGLIPSALTLKTLLEQTEQHGMNADFFNLANLEEDLSSVRNADSEDSKSEVERLTLLDVNLTVALLKLVDQIQHGFVKPQNVDAEWFIAANREAPYLDVIKVIDSPMALSEYINSLYPTSTQYLNLVLALKSYQDKLKKEPSLELQLKWIEDIKEIKLNLERWRWLPRTLGKRYIIVNIPDFKTTLYEDSKEILSMKSIVGKCNRRTPSFQSWITAAEANPKWVVPERIATEDLLPILKTNPHQLIQNGFQFYHKKNRQKIDPHEVIWKLYDVNNFPFKVFQEAGANNALGKIKFWIPNSFGILMHGTPAPFLFDQQIRTFSSGCIRIEKPVQLAEFLLRDIPESQKNHFFKDLETGHNNVVSIAPAVPLYVLYMTAWVDENGNLQLRSDVYGRNSKLRKVFQ